MGLAKSAPQPVVAVETPSAVVVSDGIMSFNGLPLSVADYFNVDIFSLDETQKNRLTEVYTWAKNKVPEGGMGDVMSKISELERQLGATSIGEKRSDRLWRWCKLASRIDDLEKERTALERRRLV